MQLPFNLCGFSVTMALTDVSYPENFVSHSEKTMIIEEMSVFYGTYQEKCVSLSTANEIKRDDKHDGVEQ
jgi:hypothetical protein